MSSPYTRPRTRWCPSMLYSTRIRIRPFLAGHAGEFDRRIEGAGALNGRGVPKASERHTEGRGALQKARSLVRVRQCCTAPSAPRHTGLALTNITNTEYSQEQFQTTGGVDVAVAILLAATDPTVLVNLLTALANVCLHPQVSEKVAQHPQAVYAMLRCCMLPHAEVQRRALQGLANLSAAEANCRVLARHDVLPALQAAAERGGPDRHAQCYVAGTLANFAENGLGARVAAGRGVDLLLLLGRTPSEPVQTAVARALAALAQDEALQPVLARSGGLALLVDMARSPYVAVQAQAGAALAAFAQPAVGAAAPPRAAPPARPQCVVC